MKRIPPSSSRRVPREEKIAAVDLFCGVGGKTHGFINAGIPVVAGYDIDVTCQYAYENNNVGATFVCKGVEQLAPSELESWYPKGTIKVLIGCAPCQPFSTYSYRYATAPGKRKSKDKRWALLYRFRDLIRAVRPEIVSAENVPELARLKHDVYVTFVKDLRDMGYHVTESIVRCAEYGVPQTRERLVLLASLRGPLNLIPATHQAENYTSVHDAIGHLPAIIAGGPSPANDPMHVSSRLSPLNLERIRSTPEGGGWPDWPEHLKLACHKRDSGATYPSVYGRMRWDKPGPTITTQCYGLGNGRFGHPSQDRAISLREAALLQTFPSKYSFAAPGNKIIFRHIGRHIGNAVPVKLAEAVALSIRQHLRDFPTS
jgi:DNA (cytosine-5)-methyltransferase 1